LVIKNLDPDPDSLEMMDPDPDSLEMMDPDSDPLVGVTELLHTW
jgi:hypothetical protein